MQLALELQFFLSLFIINEVLCIGGGLLGCFLFACVLLLKIHSNLSFHLSKVLGHVLVTFFESLFSKLSNLSGHHALLVLEEAVRSTKEAIKRYNLLEEPKLGVFFRFGVCLDRFLNRGMDLGVDL
jgi:hypothetical protein